MFWWLATRVSQTTCWSGLDFFWQVAVAHPNVPEVLIRVRTDGSVTPREVFIEVCKQLISAYGQLGREFTREYELRRMVAAGEQENGGGNGGNGGNAGGNSGGRP